MFFRVGEVQASLAAVVKKIEYNVVYFLGDEPTPLNAQRISVRSMSTQSEFLGMLLEQKGKDLKMAFPSPPQLKVGEQVSIFDPGAVPLETKGSQVEEAPSQMISKEMPSDEELFDPCCLQGYKWGLYWDLHGNRSSAPSLSRSPYFSRNSLARAKGGGFAGGLSYVWFGSEYQVRGSLGYFRERLVHTGSLTSSKNGTTFMAQKNLDYHGVEGKLVTSRVYPMGENYRGLIGVSLVPRYLFDEVNERIKDKGNKSDSGELFRYSRKLARIKSLHVSGGLLAGIANFKQSWSLELEFRRSLLAIDDYSQKLIFLGVNMGVYY